MKKLVTLLLAAFMLVFTNVAVNATTVADEVSKGSSASAVEQVDTGYCKSEILDNVTSEAKCDCTNGKACSCCKCTKKCDCGCKSGKACTCCKCSKCTCGDKNCTCNDKCTCGCKDGKACTCTCGDKCNCTCGCKDGTTCTCGDKCSCKCGCANTKKTNKKCKKGCKVKK